jgi:hypothetical protein
MFLFLVGVLVGGVLVFKFRSEVGEKVSAIKKTVKAAIKDAVKDSE